MTQLIDAPEIDGFMHERVLGSGGFADVHLYTQRFPRRQVAIKVLKVETLDRETRRQFVAEANVMAQLSTHPAIATIYGADITVDGRPYLIMEYCSGGSLGVRYRDQPLGVEEVLQIGVRIASALESAHRAGVVHHDVKPANILITDYGAPVLTDFGISIGDEILSEATMFRTQHSSASIEAGGSGGSVGLSVPWAPPEAFDDHPEVDARSDVYSLGATLFSLMEGRSPFEVPGGANSAVHLSRRIERGELTPGAVTVPSALSDALRRAMNVRQAKRQATARELGESLQGVQRDRGDAVTPFDLVRVGDASSPETGALDEALVETRLRVRPEDTQRVDAPPSPPAKLAHGRAGVKIDRLQHARRRVGEAASAGFARVAPARSAVASGGRAIGARLSRVNFLVAAIAVLLVGGTIALVVIRLVASR